MVLKNGMNFGGYLSQCVHTKEHYASFITEKDVKEVCEYGFDHIRLPFDYNVVQNDDGTFKEEGFALIDQFIDWCKKYKMNVVLDLHKACGYDFNDAAAGTKNTLFTDPKLQDLYLSLWDKVSERYGKYDFIAFELLNEVVEDKNADLWNDLIDKAVPVIRKNAPSAKIIYGGIMWNNAKMLKLLRNPHDENIIFTFHFYSPIKFTHQKAYWMKDTIDQGLTVNYPGENMEYHKNLPGNAVQATDVYETKCEKMGPEYMEEIMMEAINSAKKMNVSVYCGEFGVIDQAPVEDTVNWFRDVASVFKKHNISTAVWTWKAMDFGLTQDHLASAKDEIISFFK